MTDHPRPSLGRRIAYALAPDLSMVLTHVENATDACERALDEITGRAYPDDATRPDLAEALEELGYALELLRGKAARHG